MEHFTVYAAALFLNGLCYVRSDTPWKHGKHENNNVGVRILVYIFIEWHADLLWLACMPYICDCHHKMHTGFMELYFHTFTNMNGNYEAINACNT
jgi:hypothetical protein